MGGGRRYQVSERPSEEQSARFGEVGKDAKEETEARGIFEVQEPERALEVGEEQEYLVALGREKWLIEAVERVRGKLRVMVEKGKEAKGIKMLKQRGPTRPVVRTIEQWAGIVAFGKDTKTWGGPECISKVRGELAATEGTTVVKNP